MISHNNLIILEFNTIFACVIHVMFVASFLLHQEHNPRIISMTLQINNTGRVTMETKVHVLRSYHKYPLNTDVLLMLWKFSQVIKSKHRYSFGCPNNSSTW